MPEWDEIVEPMQGKNLACHSDEVALALTSRFDSEESAPSELRTEPTYREYFM